MCIIYTETPICSFNYLNFYDLNKHGLGCLVPLREVRFTWHRKQDPHICGVPGGPLEQALNTMRSRATLHSLPWSQTHRYIDQFHPQSFPRSSEVEIFFFLRIFWDQIIQNSNKTPPRNAFSWHRRWYLISCLPGHESLGSTLLGMEEVGFLSVFPIRVWISMKLWLG